MAKSIFKEFDLVWAKFMNFNHWPAIIVKPDQNVPEKPSKDAQWVYFLGDHNYAWVGEKNIKPYEEFRARFKNKKVDKPMKEMETYIKKKAEDPNYKIPISKFVGKKTVTAEKKPPVSRKRGRKPLTSENEEAAAAPPAKTRYVKSDSNFSEKSDGTQEDAQTSKVDDSKDDSDHIIGFFAGNINAEYFLAKLIAAKIEINVWFENKNWAQKLEYLQYYAREKGVFYRVCSTPQLVIANSEATFSCLSSPEQAKSVVEELRIADKNHYFLKGKAYIEMTSITSDLSREICSLIKGRDGLYLEAMIQGGKDTDIQLLLAGEKSVAELCKPWFKAIGGITHLGEAVGKACDFHLAFQMLRGNMLVAMTEGVALANQNGFSLSQMRSLFKITNISCEYIDSKITSMINGSYDEVNETMQQLQKDLSQSLRVYEELKHPTFLTANTHETLKHCCNWGYGDMDSSKIYQKIRY